MSRLSIIQPLHRAINHLHQLELALRECEATLHEIALDRQRLLARERVRRKRAKAKAAK